MIRLPLGLLLLAFTQAAQVANADESVVFPMELVPLPNGAQGYYIRVREDRTYTSPAEVIQWEHRCTWYPTTYGLCDYSVVGRGFAYGPYFDSLNPQKQWRLYDETCSSSPLFELAYRLPQPNGHFHFELTQPDGPVPDPSSAGPPCTDCSCSATN
jgi:hypothetical protein